MTKLEVNDCHPFREGNGRTQQFSIDQVAAAEWCLDWTSENGAINDEASRTAHRELRFHCAEVPVHTCHLPLELQRR